MTKLQIKYICRTSDNPDMLHKALTAAVDNPDITVKDMDFLLKLARR